MPVAPGPPGRRITGLSGVIITKDEAERIAACIESVADLCEEIVVLDSGSTDDTRKICERYDNVRFETRPFDGYARQKNHALELARGPWLLCLDADERVTPELAEAVRGFLARDDIRNGDSAVVGAKVMRLTYHLETYIRHSGWNHYRYRLVKRGAVEWRGVAGLQLHELLYPVGRDWDSRLGEALPGEIIHYSNTDLSNQVDTLNMYSSIYAYQSYKRNPRQGYFFRMLTKPPVKFLEIYVFKRGFLDGRRGLLIAVSSAYSTFLRWAKIYELRRTGLKRPSNLPEYIQE